MNKYNVGDKFIIEISKNDTNELDTTEYYITNGSRVYEKEELDRLQKYNEVKERLELIDELKMDEYNKGLEDGRNEVWELADKLNNMPMQDIIDIYGFNVDRCSVYSKITPQEALAKLEAYEKKIEVGDVVRLKGSDKEYVVTTIDEDRCSEIYCGVSKDGRWFSQCNVEKTGKHIDIQSVLQQIGE